MKPLACLRLFAAALLAMGLLCPLQTLAEVPPRFYWKTLSGGNAVPLIVESMNGNTNPFDPAYTVTPGANFEATLALPGYAHAFSLFNRAAMATILLPVGRISGEVTAGGNTFVQQTGGYGDPTIEFDVNILGPRAQKNAPDALRYEPRLSVDLLADLALPLGEYDSSQPLNIGQNRWYGRLGVPIVWQLGPWVPGRRTTLEFLPAVWFFGDNDDYVGQTLETDPVFELDAHLTRDFAERFWGSLDALWYVGGALTQKRYMAAAFTRVSTFDVRSHIKKHREAASPLFRTSQPGSFGVVPLSRFSPGKAGNHSIPIRRAQSISGKY
jgi:hypothetical protein